MGEARLKPRVGERGSELSSGLQKVVNQFPTTVLGVEEGCQALVVSYPFSSKPSISILLPSYTEKPRGHVQGYLQTVMDGTDTQP